MVKRWEVTSCWLTASNHEKKWKNGAHECFLHPPKLALMFVATCGKLGCNMLTLHFWHLDLLEGLTCWGAFLKVDCRKSKSLHLRWILAISASQIPPIHTRSVEPHTVVVTQLSGVEGGGITFWTSGQFTTGPTRAEPLHYPPSLLNPETQKWL